MAQFYKAVTNCAFGVGLLAFVLLWIRELRIPLCGDAIFMHYAAFLVGEYGFVPYAELFELNFPITYVIHLLVGNIFGFGEPALRIVSAGTFLVFSIFVIKQFNRYAPKVGYFTALVFGFVYMSHFNNYFQRDFLVLIPLMIALKLSDQVILGRKCKGPQLIALGVLMGVITMIKPHYFLFFPAIILGNQIIFKKPITLELGFKAFLFLIIGMFLPLAIVTFWMYQLNALMSFFEIVQFYLPSYARYRAELGDGFIINRIHLYGGAYLLVVNFIAIFDDRVDVRRRLQFLSLLTIVGWLIGWLQGDVPYYFLLYHLMFLSVIGMSFSIRPFGQMSKSLRFYANLLMPVLGLICWYKLYFVLSMSPHFPATENKYRGLVLKKSKFIQEYFESQPQQTSVQSYQWSFAINAALLEIERPNHTKYVTALQFHHRKTDVYLKGLEQDFITEIRQDLPDFFVIDVKLFGEPIESVLQVLDEFYELDASFYDVEIFKKI